MCQVRRKTAVVNQESSTGSANSYSYIEQSPKSVLYFTEMVQSYENSGQRDDAKNQSECDCCADDISKEIVINRDGFEVEVPILRPGRHDEFELCDVLEEQLRLDLQHSTSAVKSATVDFQRLLDDPAPNSMLRRLGAEDARAVYPVEYNHLLTLLRRMFFPGTWRSDFQFLSDDDGDDGEYGSCSTLPSPNGQLFARVRLHPTTVAPYPQPPHKYRDSLNVRSMSRLSTLLHELCHAFLLIYQCKNCRLHVHEQFEGHGTSWQRVACSGPSMRRGTWAFRWIWAALRRL